ncbi:MAG: 4a-hydroxytetrahydrobiopterin dehydratase [Planctomycetota bacterium]
MTKPQLLRPDELARFLVEHPRWTADADAICRALEFADFVEAFAFMTKVALYAEAHNHHPDWRNVYRRVEIRLSTHDAGGITERDLDMARGIERLLSGSTIAG